MRRMTTPDGTRPRSPGRRRAPAGAAPLGPLSDHGPGGGGGRRRQAEAGGSLGRAVAFGALTGLVLAAAITVLGGVLLITAGLIAVAGLGGWAIAVAVRAGGLDAVAPSGRRALAVGLAAAAVLGRAARAVAVRPVRGRRARPGRLPRGNVRVARPAPVPVRDRGRVGWPPGERPPVPSADRSRPRADRRPRGRVVGRPQDAGPAAAPVVPPLQRDVVDRRRRCRPARRVPRRVHQPRPSRGRVRAHGRDEPEPPATRHRPGAVRAVLQRCIGRRRPRGPRHHVAGQSRLDRFPPALGFRPDDGPGTTPIYGVPAHPHYDGDGEDRVVLIRVLDGPPA